MTPRLSVTTFFCLLAIAASAEAGETARTRNVAIVLSDRVELLDFAGPGEVFAAAARSGATGDVPAFRVYTVGTSKTPLLSEGNGKIVTTAGVSAGIDGALHVVARL